MPKKKKSGGGKHVIHPAAFKLRAMQRMEAGECVSALSRELGVRRKLLYEWRERFRQQGQQALLIDFLQSAFKHVGDSRQNQNEPGGKASTGRSGA